MEFDASSLSGEQVDIVVNMVDEAGNPSPEVTAQATRDVVGPEISITTTAADGVINTANEDAYGLGGVCEGTSNVSVTIGSLASEEVSCASGAWEITGKDVAAVPEGSVVIVIHQLDEHANPSEQTLAVTKDITPPTLGFASSSLIVNIANKDSSPHASGNCEGSEQVMVSLGINAAEGVDCINSAWSFAIADTLSAGNHDLSIVQADEFGNSSTQTETLAKDITAPTFSFASDQEINVANQGSFALSGTCSETGTITVTVATLSPVTAACDGINWATSPGLNASSLADGSISVSASMEDSVGNSTTQSTTLNKDVTTRAVAIGTLPVINAQSKTSYTVSGTCSSHSGNVTVTLVSGVSLTQTPACSSGAWSTGAIDVSTLTDGSVSVSVSFGTGADESTDTSSVTKDTVAPTVAISSSLAAINIENQDNYTVSGTCNENAAVVSILVGGLTARTVICDGSAWSLADYDATSATGASVSITASIEDDYNNSSDASAVSVARDVVNPAVTLTTTDLHINNANKASYSLAGACETGLPVSVSIGTLTAQSITCDTTDNTWEVTSFDTASLAEGVDYDLLITQTDAVGNVGRVEAQFDKDITAPMVAVTSSRNVNRAGQSDVDLAGSCSEQGVKVGITIGTAPTVEVDCTATGWVYENLDLSDIADYPEGIIALSLTHRDQIGNEASISNATTEAL